MKALFPLVTLGLHRLSTSVASCQCSGHPGQVVEEGAGEARPQIEQFHTLAFPGRLFLKGSAA